MRLALERGFGACALQLLSDGTDIDWVDEVRTVCVASCACPSCGALAPCELRPRLLGSRH